MMIKNEIIYIAKTTLKWNFKPGKKTSKNDILWEMEEKERSIP